MKAIETVYNGYKFRSRLEARWAVFFDSIGVEYEYEQEGFELESGWYLPDFYLPFYKCFVEIKPSYCKEEKDAKKKLEDLFVENKDCCCMICFGDPVDDCCELLCYSLNDSSGGYGFYRASFVEGAWYHYKGYICTKGKHFPDISVSILSSKDLLTFGWNEINGVISNDSVTEVRSNFEYERQLARQARFEHGECG